MAKHKLEKAFIIDWCFGIGLEPELHALIKQAGKDRDAGHYYYFQLERIEEPEFFEVLDKYTDERPKKVYIHFDW